MAAWAPRHLPKLRDQTVRHLADPRMPVRARTGPENQPGLDLAANHLRAAGLYWVTPQMAALAISAGESLAAARWATVDRPSPFGLIVFADGIGRIDGLGVEIPVDACTWGPSPGGCTLGFWIDRHRLVDASAKRGEELIVEQVPPLVPIRSMELPVTSEPLPLAGLPADAPRPVVAALAASWLLMMQPTLASRVIERPDKSVRAAYARAGRGDPEVSIIDLRRTYVPDQDDPDGQQMSQRRYRYRWVVSGHWRNQAYGPDRALRRPTWIPAYVKGPDGAPLLDVERVNVWRR